MKIYFVDAFAFVCFCILLIASVYMLIDFYICDNNQCKAFHVASRDSEEGSQDYILSLLRDLGFDGVWPLPYIGAAILTPLGLWLMRIPITTRNFGLFFFISFVVIYFLFSFYNHHYLKFIARYISENIQISEEIE